MRVYVTQTLSRRRLTVHAPSNHRLGKWVSSSLREGLAAARADGRVGGRQPKLSQTQRDELIRGVQEERYTMAQAARLFGVHPATVSRLMSRVHGAQRS